jgi:tetratricopeptide (TPR) repeat protein
LNLWPHKKQWKNWSLPSKLTAISALLAILSISLYFLEKTFDLISYLRSPPQPVATEKYIDNIFRDYFGEIPKNPTDEEVKSDIEKELNRASDQALELYRIGNSAYYNNRFREAINSFKAALEIVKIPSLYLSLGNSYYVSSDFQTALTSYQTSLGMFRNNKDQIGEGNALINLGNTYSVLGQVKKAIGYYEKSLAISREIENRNGEASSLGNLGAAYRNLGQVENAIGYFEQALPIYREIGDYTGEGINLGNMGAAYGILGQYEKLINLL